jgi:hypothetical protein
MPPEAGIGVATAQATDKVYEKLEGEAKQDALAMCNRGELLTAILKVPNLHFYRHRGSGEIAFAVGDDAPAWGNDPT